MDMLRLYPHHFPNKRRRQVSGGGVVVTPEQTTLSSNPTPSNRRYWHASGTRGHLLRDAQSYDGRCGRCWSPTTVVIQEQQSHKPLGRETPFPHTMPLLSVPPQQGHSSSRAVLSRGDWRTSEFLASLRSSCCSFIFWDLARSQSVLRLSLFHTTEVSVSLMYPSSPV